MAEIFNTVLDMSITASLVIIAVLLVRLLLKAAPKKWSYTLWLLVLLRLLCPLSIESALSLIPEQTRHIPQNTALDEDVDALAAIDAAQRAVGDVLNGGIEPILINIDRPETKGIETVSASHSQVWLLFFARLWPAGMIAMLIWGAVSYFRLRKRLDAAVRLEENIFECDGIGSPFVMGVFRSRIYLPSGLGEREKVYIIEHERQHLRRGDHIFKLVAYAALCLHWFNPLVWLAFVLSEKDMELACDEAVINSLGEDVRADYSASLLSLATGRRIIAGMPLAFGEGDPKGRIKNLAAWKKPAVWVSAAAVLVLIAAAVCLLTDRPEKPAGQDDLKNAIITEDGYTIRNQMVYLGLRVPKDVLTEAAYTSEGQSFGECEVLVYDEGRTKIWLKSVQQSNESENLLYFCFDFSYDLLEQGGAFYSIHRYEGNGSTACTGVGGVHNEVLSADNGDFEAAISLRGRGPGEELTFYVRADMVRQAEGTMVMQAALNQVIYSLGEALDSGPDEPASSTDVEYIEPEYEWPGFEPDPKKYGQDRDIGELWYTELHAEGTVDIGVNLVYDDENLLVFQAERGLYAYDFASERILIAVDTEKAVGVYGFQGSAPCAVIRVVPETQTIQLYNSDNEDYCIYIDPYKGVYWFDEFADLPEDMDKAGEIHGDGRTVGTISGQYYYRGNEKWELFENFEFPMSQERYCAAVISEALSREGLYLIIHSSLQFHRDGEPEGDSQVMQGSYADVWIHGQDWLKINYNDSVRESTLVINGRPYTRLIIPDAETDMGWSSAGGSYDLEQIDEWLFREEHSMEFLYSELSTAGMLYHFALGGNELDLGLGESDPRLSCCIDLSGLVYIELSAELPGEEGVSVRWVKRYSFPELEAELCRQEIDTVWEEARQELGLS